MGNKVCISCDQMIKERAFHDPYICRDCESLMIGYDEAYGASAPD